MEKEERIATVVSEAEAMKAKVSLSREEAAFLIWQYVISIDLRLEMAKSSASILSMLKSELFDSFRASR